MSICDGLSVGLSEVLANKEARVTRQGEWLKRHSLPLVSFSVNMPGPHKMTECTKNIFDQGVQAVSEVCIKNCWAIEGRQVLLQPTGPEAIFAVKAPSAMSLKRVMIDIEKQHHLGRIMDLDVIDINGQSISRKSQGMNWRKCFICDEYAAVCSRTRKHDLNQLVTHIEAMVRHD